MISGELKEKGIRVNIGYLHNFAGDYLTTIHFLLLEAKSKNFDIGVFTYTLPIIILSDCFLEANFNKILYKLGEKTPNFKALKKKYYNNEEKPSLIQKHELLLREFKNIDISNIEKYQKASIVHQIRNELVHANTYLSASTQLEEKFLSKLKEVITFPNTNLKEVVPFWLPYLEYNSACVMTKIMFEFYLYFSRLYQEDNEPIYQNKIERIISWHPLMQEMEGIKNAK